MRSTCYEAQARWYSAMQGAASTNNRSFDALPFDANFVAIVQARAIPTKRLSSRHENRASKNVRESGTSQAGALI
jgi:hypothetical protein